MFCTGLLGLVLVYGGAVEFYANCRVKCRVAEYNAELPSFMPSKMSIAEFYAKFFEIKILLLVQLPGTRAKQKTHKQTTNTHMAQ